MKLVKLSCPQCGASVEIDGISKLTVNENFVGKYDFSAVKSMKGLREIRFDASGTYWETTGYGAEILAGLPENDVLEELYLDVLPKEVKVTR